MWCKTVSSPYRSIAYAVLAECVSRRRIKQYVVATGAELFTQCSDEPIGGRAGATFLSSFYAQTGLANEWSNT